MSGTRNLAAPAIEGKRSALMRRIRGKDTTPERTVRRMSHSLGYRFRLHRRNLPGTPDLTFPRLRKVIFVHGCFWHRHTGCRRTTTPKTRVEYWRKKFEQNVERDRRNVATLHALGWEVLVVWECETFDRAGLLATLSRFLDQTST